MLGSLIKVIATGNLLLGRLRVSYKCGWVGLSRTGGNFRNPTALPLPSIFFQMADSLKMAKPL